jgi:predicted ferric reductase
MKTENARIGAYGLAAPAFLVTLSLAGVWWGFPANVPLWRAAAIVTAWAGTGLLVGSLALMVREPRWAALMGGLDIMYQWHHRSGVLGYTLLLCHPLALGMARLEQSPHAAWLTIAPWHLGWPEWLGWFGLLFLMAGLATTFSRRIGYRRWRVCHFLTAIGVIGGLSHIFVLLGEPEASFGFIALAAMALIWRLLATDSGLTSHPFRVTRVASNAAGVVEASLAPCGGALVVTPGQFVLAAFVDSPAYQGCGEFHPFSVSRIGPDGVLSVAIKALGPCTRRIQSLKPGALVKLQGPFGRFLADKGDRPQLWIAGGIGITPFMAAIRSGEVPKATTLIYVYREESDAAFLDELKDRACLDPDFELIAQACGESLPDVAAILSRVTRLPERQVQICGPAGLVNAVTTRLRQLGQPVQSIRYESFDFR